MIRPLLTLFLLLSSSYCCKLVDISDTNVNIPLLDCIELRVHPEDVPENPFDFDQINVFAMLNAGTGKIKIDGFYYQDFTRSLQGGHEALTPKGKPEYRIRYTPVVLGDHVYSIHVTDAHGTKLIANGTFSSESSNLPGFVRVSSPLHFSIDHDGGFFFAVGENVCWSDKNGTFDYDLWFGRLKSSSNYARLWTGVIGFNIEPDLGRYDLESLWRLDYVLNLAEQYGMRLMLTLDSFNSLRYSDPYPAWDKNPYNRANGGMLSTPQEFFWSVDARHQYWKRLRYMVARFGYTPRVFSWELWNEVDITEAPFNTTAVTAWHVAAAQYIRTIDANAHPITTSFSNSIGIAQIDSLPEMDYVQTHTYGAPDMAVDITKWNNAKAKSYGKPHIVGEFGLDLAVSLKSDPTGIAFRNGLFASAVSMGAGTAMNWWWDNYIEPDNLYHHLNDVSSFVKLIDWSSYTWKQVTVKSVNGTASQEILRVIGIDDGVGQLAFWAQDARHIWSNDGAEYIGDSSIVMEVSVKDGVYHGNCVSEQVKVENGNLKMVLPMKGRNDVACVFNKQY